MSKLKGILPLEMCWNLDSKELKKLAKEGWLPQASGGVDSPVIYPLGPPSISNTSITVDTALNNPTRITRTVAELAMQKFFADRIFSVGGGVEGGAVLFERPNPIATDLWAERDVQEVAPGEEFPIMSFIRGVPMITRPKKIGGKWFMTREARKRNDTALLSRYIRQTANTIRRKTEQIAIAELNAVIASETRTSSGQSWATAAAVTWQNRSGTNQPLTDIMAAQLLIELEERGHELNSAVLHPNQMLSLAETYQPNGVKAALSSVGITEYYVTPRQTAGKVKLYERGQVGEWRNEFPLTQETEEEGVASGGRQRTWYQWSISPVMFVLDQFAIVELTGVA